MFSQEFKYSENITVYPVKMKDILMFQAFSQSIIVRKNSVFRDKKIIKMSYLEFLLYCFNNRALEEQYEINGLSDYFLYALHLLQLCCREARVGINKQSGNIFINEEEITPQIFDDLRRIIILQNDIDFDIDEFINSDTEKYLQRAQKMLNKSKNDPNIEDYIDSLVIAMHTSEDVIMKMTIRKFYRYLKRYRLCEFYQIAKAGESSGFVKYKEPLEYWMVSLDVNDKYSEVKTDENELRGKVH